MAKLLLLTPGLPFPPMQGTALRNWGIISGLAARHRITLLSFARTAAAAAPELLAACERVVLVPQPQRSMAVRLATLALSAQPDLALRLSSRQYAHQLQTLLAAADFAVIQVEGLELGRYMPMLRAYQQRHPAARIIYDAHNAEVLLQQSAAMVAARNPAHWLAAAYSRIQLPRLQRFERAVCASADAITCVSAADAAALRALHSSAQPVLVPNGIWLRDYPQLPAPLETHTPQLLFTGKMDYRPNVDGVLWFAGAVLPLVQLIVPGAEFVVAGRDPAPAVQRLAGRAGVRVTGELADLRACMARATLYVVPLRMGGGTRFKILEAMAQARAVVSTQIGAAGFAVQNQRELLIADSPTALADAIISLLQDAGKRNALCSAARAFVAQNHDWSAILPTLEAVYSQPGK